MATCHVCGSPVGSPGPSAWCPRCGTALAVQPQPPQHTWAAGTPSQGHGAGARPTPQRTLMGVAAPFGEVPASVRPHGLGSTEVIPSDPIGHTQTSGTPGQASAAGRAAAYDPLTDPHSTANTIIDIPVFDKEHRLAGTEPFAPAAGSPEARSGGTLMGVARPGIAPLRPGVKKTPIEDDPPPSYRPLEELGATQNVPRRVGPVAAMPPAKRELEGTHPLGKRRFDKRAELRKPQVLPKGAAKKPGPQRAVMLVAAALVLVIGAVAAVLLWPKASPLKAQVRSVDGGDEVFDVACETCPDGTVVQARGAEGQVSGGRATIRISTPLPMGDTKVSFKINRPGSGRDESVEVPVRVAYRIKPDLTTLDADRPSLQIVVEAMAGAKVELDGEEVPLRDGHAIKSVDVSKDLAGAARDAPAQLSRRISFVVQPPDGPEEKGVVAVSVPIVPLSVSAPGRAIITEKQTFLLAGRTSPGAEVLVAGRSLGISKDGTFSQTMNVSSVGATEIEVRAKMKGSAPRLVNIAVERVSGLEPAAADFAKRAPLDYAGLMAGLGAATNKPVALAGEVLEVRSADGVTTMILSVPPPACSAAKCLARLVQGRADLGVDRGAKIRAYGAVSGVTSHEGADIPDIDVAFSITDQPAPGAPAPPLPPKP